MTALSRVHVVSHTHWDREWYHTAHRFRQRLVPFVDELLDDPPAPQESFLLDGQAILLEDYLEVRPDRAAELSTLLREGRLEAGPWYVLPDELIPGGEALIRNLLAGRDVVRRLRGDAPPVLYCPDSFGHPAVLPELAHGFGCLLIVVWRGLGGHRWPAADTLRWRGPTGTVMTVFHLPPPGYEAGASLPTDLPAARQRWQSLHTVLSARATTGESLLLNGADHHARQRDRTAALLALTDAARPVEVCATSLRSAAESIVRAASTRPLAEITGELRDSYGYSWTLGGTLATRAAQKRRNALVERLLIRDVEPWLAIAPDGNSNAARALLRAAWRTVLRAHPHDTLCGTSIDDVANAMDARLADASEQARGLREDALMSLIGHDRDQARLADQHTPVVVLRNPSARARSGVVELTLSAAIARVAVGPGSADRQEAPRRLAPWRVADMALQILDRRDGVALTESPRAYPRADSITEVRALGWVEDMPGYSIETRLQRGRRGLVPTPVSVDEPLIENGLLRVAIGADGAVRVEDQATGRVVERLIDFEWRRDVGDLYTPALRETLPEPRLRRIRVVHRGPLRGEIALHFTLSTRPSGSVSKCRLHVALDAGLRAVRLAVEGENRTKDHRLQLVVHTGVKGGTTVADAAFHPVAREPLAIDDDDALMERVVPTAPLHRWVARFADERGATIFSDGLAEYESRDDGAVAITLIRAVGELSRADLPERPGHAGWPAETPGAQCLGEYASQFAFALHDGDSMRVRDLIETLADDVLLPLTGATLRTNVHPPSRAGGLELEGDGLVFSAAVLAQRPGWITLRCVNRRHSEVDGRWRLPFAVSEAWRARLDETAADPVEVQGEIVLFRAAPGEIVTILVLPARESDAKRGHVASQSVS